MNEIILKSQSEDYLVIIGFNFKYKYWFGQLRDNTGSVLDDTTITVQVGMQRLYFDFDIPTGVDLELGVSSGNTRLFRDNAGNGNSMAYPYNAGNNVTITSSVAGDQYYYFFYDLEIMSSPTIPCYNIAGGILEVLNPIVADP